VSASLEETAAQKIVLLAVPVSALRDVLRMIRPLVKPPSTVIDVCAVKAGPVQWMASLLPKGVTAIGCHPFFGPDSYGGSLKGHRVVLCPVRGSREVQRKMKSLLRRAGLQVDTMTPDAHDRRMAETVFLTQLVGRSLASAHLGEDEGWTVHSRRLRSIVAVARNDSDQLFVDMWKYNPHAREVARRFGKGWQDIRRLLDGSTAKRAGRQS